MRGLIPWACVAGQGVLTPTIGAQPVPRASEVQEQIDRAYENSLRQAEDYVASLSNTGGVPGANVGRMPGASLGSSYGLQSVEKTARVPINHQISLAQADEDTEIEFEQLPPVAVEAEMPPVGAAGGMPMAEIGISPMGIGEVDQMEQMGIGMPSYAGSVYRNEEYGGMSPRASAYNVGDYGSGMRRYGRDSDYPEGRQGGRESELGYLQARRSSRSDLVDEVGEDAGRRDAEFMQLASPLGVTASPLGVTASPLGVTASPLGVTANPLGVTANPVGAETNALGAESESAKTSTLDDIIETLLSSNFNITESVQKLATSGIDLNSIVKDSVTGKPSVDALIKNIANSDIDVNSFVQRLADSGLDMNKLVEQIANSPISIDKVFQNLYNGGVDFNKMVKDIESSGLDIDDNLKKLNESGIDPSTVIDSPALAAIINSGALANPHLTDMLDALAKRQ